MPEVDSSIQVLGFRSKSKRPQKPIQISVSNPDWIGIRWPPGFPPKNLTSWLYLFIYIRTTNLKKGIKELKNQNTILQFEGLDTYTEVFLNNKKILDANNMFRTWKVDVKNNLKFFIPFFHSMGEYSSSVS